MIIDFVYNMLNNALSFYLARRNATVQEKPAGDINEMSFFSSFYLKL